MERNKREAKCSKCGEILATGVGVKHNNKIYCELCLPEPKDTRQKCDVCKLHFDEHELISHTSRGKTKFYCRSCQAVLHTEERALYDLGEYIYEKHEYKEKGIGYEYIVGQLKILKNMYPHYKYAGMLASLKYYYEILENEPHPNPYKLIPYIYEKAKEFYELRREVTTHNREVMARERIIGEVIHMKDEPPKPRLRAKIIDIDE